MWKASRQKVTAMALATSAMLWGSTGLRAESLTFQTEAPFPMQHTESYSVTTGDDFVRVVRTKTALPTDTWIAGVPLDKSYETAFGGNEIEVTITARAVGATSAYEAAYFTLGDGNSGRQTMSVTKEFSDRSFRYAVPKVGRPGGDYIGVDTAPGDGVEIKSITAKVVPSS